ncbi:olfactory receptor class A-like protein 4 [Puntigrus tetrazona]|uniref:olfactory receptor class A-like protein 4 n=1 Tax=Puntigrus tetrazona TaxID=1606681 RepID=UPI001C897620|nr:olfactory receptor class A-like protein 4 [Puntigrus tetrazona]
MLRSTLDCPVIRSLMATKGKTTSSVLYIVVYLILVLLGNVGNTTVIAVVGDSLLRETGAVRSSDVILVNMAFSNLMVSLTRNSLLVITDMGMEVFLNRNCCRLMMGIWVWLRSANVWSTFFLSAFHFQTLRRVAPPVTNVHGHPGPPRSLVFGLCLIWSLNLIYSIPAFIFSKNGDENSTESLMLVSSTTRPLLGCIWSFPTVYSGLAFATTSMVIHELFPIILMSATNLGSLLTLYAHGQTRRAANKSPDAPVITRIPAERRAAKVILALNVLFISSWGASVISINYFNYNRGSSSSSTEFVLIVARIANITFIALSPVVLAVGHRKLRAFMTSILSRIL